MKIGIRTFIYKIKPLHILSRMVVYDSNIFFYRKIYKDRNLGERFQKLKDSKKGNRCFIIGNGPSLKPQDLDRLKDEDCLASNNIYKIFSQTTWRPKYYLVIDRYAKIPTETIENLDVETVFIGDYFWKYHPIQRQDAVCLHGKYMFSEKNPKISTDISKCYYSASTVSFALMQIAAYIGYSEIYLLGFDHNYTYEVNKNGKVIKTNTKEAHFFKDDIPKEIIANVQGMTYAYVAFSEYAKTHGISVYNATRGGKLEVFQRVDFDSLF